MLVINIDHPVVSGSVNPGGSKSISNRMLILRALTGVDMPIYNISTSADTAVLIRLLKENPIEWDVNDAGTAARFCAAYLSAKVGEEHILTGSGRMQQRPMKPLFDVLIEMGADIIYLGQDGHLPVKIVGKKLNGGTFKLPHDVSSQFVSALALIAPFGKDDLTIQFDEPPFSGPYISMTLDLLDAFGIHIEEDSDDHGCIKILIRKGELDLPKEFLIEQDWSSASYWYSAVALADKGEILLENYTEGSIQGDSIVKEIFNSLGVSSRRTDDGIWIKKTEKPETDEFEFDFSDYPDLVPTMAVTLPLMGIPSRLTGLQTLRHKESDRVNVIAENLRVLGVSCKVADDGNALEIDAAKNLNSDALIQCHGDHRMAMAFVQAVLKTGEIAINTPEVTEKSYANFWNQLANVYKSTNFVGYK